MKFLDAEFVQGFIRMADDGWNQGWHERNGGNLSYRVKPEEVENVKENLDQNIYKTIIPRNVRLAEAPSYGKPINLYDSRSTGAESYRLLAEEVISREGE